MLERQLLGRRQVLRVAAASGLCAVALPALAQPYPSRPIHLLVGYPPGSSSDTMARILAKSLGEVLQTPIVVEHKPGASGSAAAAQVAKAANDGYTLYYGLQDSQILLPLLKRNAPYKPDSDFTPIAEVVELNLVLVTNAATGIKSMSQLVARAKEKPGSLRFSSSGIGGVHHLTMEMMMQKTGTQIQHVPYQGGGPALMGLLRGDVEVMVASESLVKAHVTSGKLIALATTGKQPSAQLKNVPTMEAAGVPLQISAWYGLFGPPALPERVTASLAEAARVVVASAEYRQQLQSVGAEPAYVGGADFAQFLKNETRAYKEVIERANIKIEDY